MDFLDSPKEGSQLRSSNKADGFDGHTSSPEELPSDDFIKVKLFFFTESKQLHNKVFPDEWFTVMEGQYGDEVSRTMQPWLELEVADHLNFGEMLTRFLQEANFYFKEM